MSMAICCLLIETTECFYQGLPDTKKPGEGDRVFQSFFDREKVLFPGLCDKSSDFYNSVRCGLLHQAETMNGWFLNKKGDLFSSAEGIKTINGELFLKATKKSIENYLTLLTDKKLDDALWGYAFDKLIQICNNCREIENTLNKPHAKATKKTA
jgi:hypothetical protein